jgi:hypothetical protein
MRRIIRTEEVMRTFSMAAAAVVVAVAATTGSALAASEDGSTCATLDSKVGAALDSGQQTANRDEVQKQRNLGRDYCRHGFYKIGNEHFDQALKLLNVQPTQNG